MIDIKSKLITYENIILRSTPEVVGNGFILRNCNLYGNDALMSRLAGLADVTLERCVFIEGSVPGHIKQVDCYTRKPDTTPVKTQEEIEAEVQDAYDGDVVDKYVELCFRRPAFAAEKTKGQVDRPTTESLLSSNGKPVKIDAPEGWK